MALDWNKEISLSTILGFVNKSGKGKGAQKKSSEIPTKTTMNLCVTEQNTADVRKRVLIAILAVVVTAAFVKFGVLDPLGGLASKQAELERQQAILSETMSGDTDYQEVLKLYEAYAARYREGAIDAIEVLDIVEQRVKSVARVTQIVLADNTLTLTLEGATLQTVGDLANTLEKDPMVVRTNVSSAERQHDGTENTVSTLVVTLVSPETQSKE